MKRRSSGHRAPAIPLPVVFLFSLTLVISIALNLTLFNRGREFYVRLNTTTLDPLGLSHYPIGEQIMPASGIQRVVLFGDSRAQDWPPAGLAGYEFVNRGVGGQTSVQALGRFEAHVAPLRPDIVVIQVGINDLTTIPLFPDRQASIVQNCAANIEQLVEQSTDLGAIVVLTTIFSLGDPPLERRLLGTAGVSAGVQAVNEHIHSLARDGVIVIDSGQVLAGEHGMVRREYSRDMTHLNEAGYAALNQQLITVLERIGQ